MTDRTEPDKPLANGSQVNSSQSAGQRSNPDNGKRSEQDTDQTAGADNSSAQTSTATSASGNAPAVDSASRQGDSKATVMPISATTGKHTKEKALSNSSSSSSSKLTVATLILSLSAAVGVGYLWNESRVEKARLDYANKGLQADIVAQATRLEALQASLRETERKLQESQTMAAQIAGSTEALDARMIVIEAEIAEITGSSRIDWMLREVEHFVMVAERRLSLLADVDGALALLIEADELVRDMGEPAARPLRTTLQADLLALQQAASVSVDTEGLFAKLSLLGEKVPALRAASINYEMSLASEERQVNVPSDGLAYAWYEVKRFVLSLVRVQRVTDGQIKPLLLQDQQIFVEQNIRLLMEQAQLAILRGDQVVFDASLGEVQSRVREYLRTNTPEAEAFLATVAQLRAATVKPAVPSIEASVRAVQVFRDYWQREKVERQLGAAAIQEAVDSAAQEPAKEPAPAMQATVPADSE